MDLAFAFACAVLAGVFALAAVAKLVDRAGAPDAVRAFGVPARLARPVAVLLPVAEIVVAALLLFPATSVWGGLGALVLLTAFIAAITANLRRGQRPTCHCFGQLHAAPVGWHTVVRNTLLAAVAALVVIRARTGEPPSIVEAVSGVSDGRGAAAVAILLLLTVLGVQGWLLFHLLRQQGRLWLRIDAMEAALRDVGLLTPDPVTPQAGLPVGGPAPTFELPTLSNGRVSLRGLLRQQRPVVLVFSEPGCPPCAELLPELGRWARQHVDAISLVVVTHSVTDEYRDRLAAVDLPIVLVQRDREVAGAFDARGTPSAVLVEVDGTVGSSLATGATAIRDLLARAVEPRAVNAERLPAGRASGSPTMPVGVQVGSRVPDFRLLDLDDRPMDSASFHGRSHLLLFWNPDCGFCKQMLPELRAWERREADGAPALVVVSTGTIEANRDLGLRAPVLLDPGFTVGTSLGIRGTPSAAMLDADGTLIAPVAVGAPQIFAVMAATESDPAVAAAGGIA
jgi:thiol-disulfide isomerase/thioredoxin